MINCIESLHYLLLLCNYLLFIICRKEVEELMKSSFTKAVLLAPFYSAPKFMICITMLVFVQFNNHVFSINQVTNII